MPDDAAAVWAQAKKVVYDRLAERPRSRADLEQTLAKKQIPAEVGAAVLDRCEQIGLVDDAAFARSWVEGRQRGKGLATRALALELRQHGVADEIARDALAQVDPEVERQAAHRLVQRRLPSVSRFDRVVQQRRLVAMLARKGYDAELARQVVEAEIGAAPDVTDW